MILPDKHVTMANSGLGVGAVILRALDRPASVSRLWEKVLRDPRVGSFEVFVLTLDLLYATGAVDYDGTRLTRARR